MDSVVSAGILLNVHKTPTWPKSYTVGMGNVFADNSSLDVQYLSYPARLMLKWFYDDICLYSPPSISFSSVDTEVPESTGWGQDIRRTTRNCSAGKKRVYSTMLYCSTGSGIHAVDGSLLFWRPICYCSTVLCLHNQLNLNLIFFIKKQCNSYSNFIKRYSHLKERNFYVTNEEMSVISWLFSMQKIFFLF